METKIDKRKLSKAEREKLLQERDKERNARWIAKFERLQPFCGDVSKIPEIPIMSADVYTEHIVKNLIRCGAIPKSELEVGKEYIGSCRNAEKAVWNGKRFEYQRYKFGDWTKGTSPHFEDICDIDVFVPIKDN